MLNAFHVDAGTMCRGSSPKPGTVGNGPTTPSGPVYGPPAPPVYGPPAPEVYGPPAPEKTAVSAKKYDVDAAVSHIDENAHASSQGKCARYVREAIEAGGVTIPAPRPLYAKDYGPKLTELGFKKVDAKDYVPQKGDIIVLEPPTGQTAGHIEMYNGTKWVSDFVQSERIYPGPAYRKEEVAYEIFRP